MFQSVMLLTICNLTVLPSSSIVRIFCSRRQLSSLDCRPSLVESADCTHEINTNSGDVGFGVGIIGES